MVNSSLLVGVTGTPASGKSSFAKRLSRVTGVEMLEINSVLSSSKSLYRMDAHGEMVARMEPLERRLKEIVRGRKIILTGHLAQDLGMRYDCLVVVRCGIGTLFRRMKARHYGLAKIRENLSCEAMDCCGAEAYGKHRNVIEVETAEEKAAAIRMVRSRSFSGSQELKEQKDKMPEFARFIASHRKLGL